MLPISALRTWGLGTLSWLMIAVGIWCLWNWNERRHQPMPDEIVLRRAEVEGEQPAELPPPEEIDRVQRIEDARQQKQRADMAYLSAAIALLACSGFGFLPVTLFLAWPGGKPAAIQGETIWLDRPDGTRLHLKVVGQRSQLPTLILTHGWSLDSSAWDYQQDLAKDFRLVLWDLPGLGASNGPPDNDYSLEKMAGDLAAVIEVAGDGPVVLVSHSIGGMMTQTFCRLFPEMLKARVAGIVLLHTTYTNPLRTAFLAPLWSALETPLIVPLNYLNIWLAPLAWLSNLQSFLNGSLHITTRFTSFAGNQTWGELQHGAWLAVKAWPGVVGRGNLAMLEFDERLTLERIETPTLVIAADHDRMTLPTASRFIEDRLPHGLFSHTTGGHLSYWEQHKEVLNLIREFAERFKTPAVKSDSRESVRARSTPPSS